MNYKTAIAVFCYRRPAKLRRSMEALLANPECASLDAVFFCDGPKGEADRDGVVATRKYIDSLTGFRSIQKHYREQNVTTGPNFISGLRWMSAHYHQFIVVEDDLVVSPNFIRYLLDALDFYRLEPAIFCVTGFNFPVTPRNYAYDTVIARRFCSYGWAIWSNRLENIVWSKEGLRSLIKNSPGFRDRLNREGLDLFRMLRKQINGRISTWDIQMQVHVSENGLRVVYPTLSKATNIGFDHESTNTFGVDYLRTTVDPGFQRAFTFCDARLQNDELLRAVRHPYSPRVLVRRKLLNTLIKFLPALKSRL